MNKFFFILFIALSGTNSIALCNCSALLFENDTLNKQYFDSLSFNTYSSLGGGFASGNNAYKDLSKAQEFHAGNLCNIYAVLINFGYKNFTSLNDSSYVGINFYHLNSLGRSTNITNVPCPGNVFFKDSIKVSDIDTANGNVFSYNNPIYTDSNFAIGIDFDSMSILDTVALYTNKDGDAGTREQSWEQDFSGNWYTLKYNWPLNVDYAIFPIVNTSVGLNVISNNMPAFQLYPNPSANGYTKINLPILLIQNLQVYNSNLQLINSQITGTDETSSTIQFDICSKGIYFIKIKTNNLTSVQKIIVN
jgi:hypothetical protein